VLILILGILGSLVYLFLPRESRGRRSSSARRRAPRRT